MTKPLCSNAEGRTKHVAARAAMAVLLSLSMMPAAALAVGVDDSGASALAQEEAQDEATYVLMNIPYDDFYKAEIKNDVKVDGFTSATKTKTRTGTLSGGSYHADDSGESILGVTYAVKLGEGVTLEDVAKLGGKKITDADKLEITTTNRGQTSTTTYEGKDAIYEAPSYSYYVLSEAPTSYKELTIANGVASFGAVSSAFKSVSAKAPTLSTESNYGDYQLTFGDDLKTAMFGESGEGTVYAVTINTTDGTGYGLRHLENIWRVTNLAWSCGFTSSVHGCPTSSAHYESMMGKTINSVTYYTSAGVFKISVGNIYVPVKFADMDASVETVQKGVQSAAVELPELPTGYTASYSIEGWNAAVAIKDGKLTIPSNQANGSYTLVVSDSSGKYASFSASFEIKANAAVELNSAKGTLATLDGSDVSAYASAITSVTIDGKEYSASGRGAVAIFNADGTIIAGSDPIAAMKNGESVAMTIKATGYNDLTVTYTKTFTDVVAGSWYVSGINYVADKGIMTGYGNSLLFGVNKPLTRAELAVIMWRIAGQQPENYDCSKAVNETELKDIADGQFYTDAANWAVKNGVFNGYVNASGERVFDPNGAVSLDQLLTVLGNYAAEPYEVDAAKLSALDKYADASSVRSWAKQAVAWGTEVGLVSGCDLGGTYEIRSSENMSRERIAVVLMNAFENGILE